MIESEGSMLQGFDTFLAQSAFFPSLLEMTHLLCQRTVQH
jgi:hypothetical protein